MKTDTQLQHDVEQELEWDPSVRRLRGVKGVSNRIVVEPRVEAKDVKHDIELAFEQHALVDARQVRVTVHESEVTLSGHVRSWAERDDADRCAWAGTGVTGVINALEVTTSI